MAARLWVQDCGDVSHVVLHNSFRTLLALLRNEEDVFHPSTFLQPRRGDAVIARFGGQWMRKMQKGHKSPSGAILPRRTAGARRRWPSRPRLCANNPSDRRMPSISTNNPPPPGCSVWRAIPTEMQTPLSSSFYGQVPAGGLRLRTPRCNVPSRNPNSQMN